MSEYYFSVNLDEKRQLCIAPLSERMIECLDIDISDVNGHFLFERSGSLERPSVKLLAKIIDDEAVFELRHQFQMV
jgi:hypothetical protein